MELEVTPAFPTLIGSSRVPDAGVMNEELHALILAEEAKNASLGRSNVGGWHSRTDFLNRPETAVGALTTWITWAVNQIPRQRPPLQGHDICFRVGKRFVVPGRPMRPTLTRTARGPVCTTWMPGRTTRIGRSAACWSSSIHGLAWRR